jgi:hypothetical protein
MHWEGNNLANDLWNSNEFFQPFPNLLPLWGDGWLGEWKANTMPSNLPIGQYCIGNKSGGGCKA